MRAATRLACLASAALVLAACESVQPPASGIAAVSRQESYFASDQELRELLQSLVEDGQGKGFAFGLLEPDGRRRIIVYGDPGAGARPLSSKSGYEIGPFAKTFTATVLADMVRRGELSLDDPVSKFLPAEVKVPSRNGRQITLQDLATQTSGLPQKDSPDKIKDPLNPYAAYQIENVHNFLSSHQLRRDVGAQWEYSNFGFGLLGHVLARAAGVSSIAELVRERIIGPLKLKMTGYGRNLVFAAKMDEAFGLGLDRLELALQEQAEQALAEGGASSLWRDAAEARPLTPMTADQALLLLELHRRNAALGSEWHRLSKRKRRGPLSSEEIAIERRIHWEAQQRKRDAQARRQARAQARADHYEETGNWFFSGEPTLSSAAGAKHPRAGNGVGSRPPARRAA